MSFRIVYEGDEDEAGLMFDSWGEFGDAIDQFVLDRAMEPREYLLIIAQPEPDLFVCRFCRRPNGSRPRHRWDVLAGLGSAHVDDVPKP